MQRLRLPSGAAPLRCHCAAIHLLFLSNRKMLALISQAAPRRRGTSLLQSALGLGTALLISLSSSYASAQTPVRGGTLNFVVTPEPTALVDLATTATNVLKVSAKVVEGLLEYDF